MSFIIQRSGNSVTVHYEDADSDARVINHLKTVNFTIRSAGEGRVKVDSTIAIEQATVATNFSPAFSSAFS